MVERVRAPRRAAHGQRPGQGAVRLGALARSPPSARCRRCSTSPRAFADEKRRRGFVEYSDQVALALAVVRAPARAWSTTTARRFRVVLLDEYQDTSVVQTRLLSALFAGQPVMAVGDPHQSIYGWRGASAANLGRFSADFTGEPGAAERPTSTRCQHELAQPDAGARRGERARRTAHRRVAGPRRAARSRGPGAAAGELTAAFEQTVADEADAVAALARRAAAASATPTGVPPSAALLCRSLKKIDVVHRGARPARHPVPRARPRRTAGAAGGRRPGERASACMHDPTAGLRADPAAHRRRWRDRRRRTSPRCATSPPGSPSATTRTSGSTPRCATGCARSVARRGGRLARRRARLRASRRPTATAALAGFSAGRARADARRRRGSSTTCAPGSGSTCSTSSRSCSRSCCSTSRSPRTRPRSSARRASTPSPSRSPPISPADDQATLGSFLAWLAEAEQRDDLAPRSEEPEPGTVQILTIHGSKGLEWDVVAVPRLVEGELPGPPQSRKGWLRVRRSCRTSSAATPPSCPCSPGAPPRRRRTSTTSIAAFEAENVARAPRRAAPARSTSPSPAPDARLLLTGSYWSTQTKPARPRRLPARTAGGRSAARGRVPRLRRARREPARA